MDTFLAFAPGGQAEMTLLAVIVGADLGFVIVHHLAYANDAPIHMINEDVWASN